MYQQEMFSGKAFKNAKFLASGCYGRVHAIDEHWVVKYAQNDGTRNYLEWCKRMQDAGKGMLGMPEIESIVSIGDHDYMVTMRRYDKTLCSLDQFTPCFDVPARALQYPDQFDKLQVGHIAELVSTFEKYMVDTFGARPYGNYASDLHAGNFMLQGDIVIMTDPSGGSYKTELHEKELVLQ